jgi:hypothetical protein
VLPGKARLVGGAIDGSHHANAEITPTGACLQNAASSTSITGHEEGWKQQGPAS